MQLEEGEAGATFIFTLLAVGLSLATGSNAGPSIVCAVLGLFGIAMCEFQDRRRALSLCSLASDRKVSKTVRCPEEPCHKADRRVDNRASPSPSRGAI